MADTGKKKKSKKVEVEDEDMEDAPRAGLPPSVDLARKRVICGANMNYNVRPPKPPVGSPVACGGRLGRVADTGACG